jgi:hypothetical protein
MQAPELLHCIVFQKTIDTDYELVIEVKGGLHPVNEVSLGLLDSVQFVLLMSEFGDALATLPADELLELKEYVATCRLNETS